MVYELIWWLLLWWFGLGVCLRVRLVGFCGLIVAMFIGFGCLRQLLLLFEIAYLVLVSVAMVGGCCSCVCSLLFVMFCDSCWVVTVLECLFSVMFTIVCLVF